MEDECERGVVGGSHPPSKPKLQVTITRDHQGRTLRSTSSPIQSSIQGSPLYPSPLISTPTTTESLVEYQRSLQHFPPNRVFLNVQTQTSDCSQKPERHDARYEVVTENFSRPRQVSVKGRKEAPFPHLNSQFTSALSKHHEEYNENYLPTSHQRDYSSNSIISVSTSTNSIIRSPTSLSDFPTPDMIQPSLKNPISTNHRYSRTIAIPENNKPSPDSINLSEFRDPLPQHRGIDYKEIRSSFRSAVTTNSSFLGTCGTERSSVLTKSSSRTSIFGRDEGMSVDDAIEMYEQGFSGEDGDETNNMVHNIETSEKDLMVNHDNFTLKNQLEKSPQSDYVLIRDSAAIFETCGRDTPKSPRIEERSTPNTEIGFGEDSDLEEPCTPSAATQLDDTRDRYGFRKKTQYISKEEYDAWNKPYTAYLTRRKKKWIALMRQYSLPTIAPEKFPPRSDKVKRFIRKGIPPSWRGAAWFFYAGGPAILQKNPGVYQDLVRRSLAGDMTQTDDEIIERDLNRTFPDNIRFKPDLIPQTFGQADQIETPILQSLRRVLRAFSIYHPKIGYCQSLNFLAGLLLLFMAEEKAFWMLSIITRIFLPGTHSLTLEGANIDLGVLMSSIKEMMPSIWAKIGNELDGQPIKNSASTPMRLPPITLCTTAWFMSCFIGTLPIETTLRVWDSFFYEGSKTLFRIALTIFKLGEPQIRAVNDPMEIFQVVQGIPRGIMDCNLLMETCFKRRGGFVKLSQEDIERGREERRRGYAEEREKMARGTSTAVSGSSKVKGKSRKVNTLLVRGKKERIGLAVHV